MHSSTQISIRWAGPQDAPQVAALFQLAYGETSHPHKDVDFVRQFLADGRNLCPVGVDQQRIVACMGMVYHHWNETYEFGRGVTHPDYRRTGLAEMLARRAFDWVHSNSFGDLLFGIPRVRRIHELCLENKMFPTGHDGAMNVANGAREYHLLSFARKANARFQHVAPRVRRLAQSAFVQQQILRPLGMHSLPGTYPGVYFVGPPQPSPRGEFDAPFLYSFDPACPSGALEITGWRGGAAAEPWQMAHELETFLRAFPSAQHVSTDVLADKEKLIRELLAMGFEITAYLPAWFKVGARRYDCLKLVKPSFSEHPVIHGVEEVIQSTRAGFAGLFAEARPTALPLAA